MIYKQVTNNLVDVFYGKYGFDEKEWIRMAKKNAGEWKVRATRQNKINAFEIEYGKITMLEEVLPKIIADMEKHFNGRQGSRNNT